MMLDSSADCSCPDVQDDDCPDLDIRTELETMSREELIDEVLSRMKFTQSLITSNWEQTEQMQEENIKLRQSIDRGLPLIEDLKRSAKIWKCAFFIFAALTLVDAVFP